MGVMFVGCGNTSTEQWENNGGRNNGTMGWNGMMKGWKDSWHDSSIWKDTARDMLFYQNTPFFIVSKFNSFRSPMGYVCVSPRKGHHTIFLVQTFIFKTQYAGTKSHETMMMSCDLVQNVLYCEDKALDEIKCYRYRSLGDTHMMMTVHASAFQSLSPAQNRQVPTHCK
jgi:hypothetical protein